MVAQTGPATVNASGPVLRDIHVAPAPWWPPAPGWWIIAATLLVCAGIVAWWLRGRAPTAKPDATREVAALAAAYARDRNPARLAQGASALLRRVARRIDPAAASARGAQWRGFLARYSADDAQLQRLDALQQKAFRPDATLDADALLDALGNWCAVALRGRGRGAGA